MVSRFDIKIKTLFLYTFSRAIYFFVFRILINLEFVLDGIRGIFFFIFLQMGLTVSSLPDLQCHIYHISIVDGLEDMIGTLFYSIGLFIYSSNIIWV